MSPKTVRCTRCYDEFADDELDGASACPSCGTKSLPCSISDDVTVRINWHELRILCIWADNWARHIKDEYPESPEAVLRIADRLEEQYPNKTPLTIFKELKQLPFDLEVHENGQKVMVHKGGNKA